MLISKHNQPLYAKRVWGDTIINLNVPFVILKIFAGNTDRNTVITHSLKPHIEARYIRFHPLTHNRNVPCLRAELYGCRNGKSCFCCAWKNNAICTGSHIPGENAHMALKAARAKWVKFVRCLIVQNCKEKYDYFRLGPSYTMLGKCSLTIRWSSVLFQSLLRWPIWSSLEN